MFNISQKFQVQFIPLWLFTLFARKYERKIISPISAFISLLTIDYWKFGYFWKSCIVTYRKNNIPSIGVPWLGENTHIFKVNYPYKSHIKSYELLWDFKGVQYYIKPKTVRRICSDFCKDNETLCNFKPPV